MSEKGVFNILLTNKTRGWFSVALRYGNCVELRPGESYEVNNITSRDLIYYNQFISLGVTIDILNKREEVPLVNKTIEDEEVINDFVSYSNVDDIADVEVLDMTTEVSSEEDFDSYTKEQLRELCAASGVQWSRRDLKSDLIDKLRGN